MSTADAPWAPHALAAFAGMRTPSWVMSYEAVWGVLRRGNPGVVGKGPRASVVVPALLRAW